MERKITYKALILLSILTYPIFGYGQHDDIEPYISLGSTPTTINYASNQSINLADYIVNHTTVSPTVDNIYGRITCNNQINNVSYGYTFNVSSASSNQSDFVVNNSVIQFPSTPDGSEITVTFSYAALATFNYDRAEARSGNVRNGPRCLMTTNQISSPVIVGNFSLTIRYPANNSLNPGSDFTVPSSICQGTGFNIDITSPRSGSTYRVRAKGNTELIVESGTDDLTISTEQAAQLWNVGDGGYSFFITERRANGYEEIDPSKSTTVAVISSSTGNISGETQVCPEQYVHTYTTTDTGANSYQWSCNNCTLLSGNGGTSMEVRWNNSSTNGHIEVFARSISSTGNCDAASSRLDVDFSEVIQYPAITGPTQICQESTATIGLANSQLGYDYAIFSNGVEVSGAGRIAGSNSAISWSNLNPGNYEIRLQHTRCGWYSMGSRSVSYYAPYVVPTIINQGGHYCGPDAYPITANSPLQGNGYVWYENTGAAQLTEIHRGAATQNLTLDGTREYHVSYIDSRGCESNVEQIQYNVIQLPEIQFSSNPSVCTNGGDINLNNFVVSNTPNGFWIGDFNTSSGNLFVNTIASSHHNSTIGINYLYVTQNGCSINRSMSLAVNTPPLFETNQQLYSVCVGDGSVDLSSNVANVSGANLSFNVAGTDIAGSTILLGGTNYTVGQYDVVVTATNAQGCSDVRQFVLRIDDLSNIEFTQSDLTFCSYFDQIDFNQMFSGYLGEFYVNSTLVPNGILTNNMTMWNQGNNSLRFIENAGCYQEHLFNLHIRPQAVFDLSQVPTSICEFDGDVDIASLISPAGGTLSGPFTNNGNFRAQVAGPGSYDLTYTLTDQGCTYSTMFTLINKQSPNVYAGPDDQVCRNAGLIDYSNQVNVTGGDWTGHIGMSAAGTLNSEVVGAEELAVQLTYTYTNDQQCSSSDDIIVYMNDVPEVNISNNRYEFCLNAEPFDLSIDANNNNIQYWAPDGISDNKIYPRIIGSGNHVIEARETNANGCYNFKQIDVVVNDVEPLTVDDFALCANDAAYVDLRTLVSIPNGSFSGSNSLDGDHLEVGENNTGIHQLTYNVLGTDGCQIVGNFQVEIYNIPEPIELQPIVDVCYDDEQVELFVLNPSTRYEYTWYDENNQHIGTGSKMVVNNDATSYTVQSTNINNCSILSEPTTVVAHDLIGEISYEPDADFITAGSVVSFKTDFNAVNYDWTLSDRVFKTDVSPSMVYNYTDTTMSVSVLLQDEFGCTKLIEREIIIKDMDGTFSSAEIVEETAIEEFKMISENLTRIRAYPNPLSGSQLTLELQSAQEEEMVIVIYDQSSLVLHEEIQNLTIGLNELVLNIPTSINTGVYFIQVKSRSIHEFLPLLKN